jgi:hypothetical protein
VQLACRVYTLILDGECNTAFGGANCKGYTRENIVVNEIATLEVEM